MTIKGLKFIIIATLMMMSTLAYAEQYALGISTGSLCVLGTGSSLIKSYSKSYITGAGDFTGVAVYKDAYGINTAYVGDSNGMVHVIKINNILGSNTFQFVRSIDLKANSSNAVSTPGSVTVDSNGNAYVIDQHNGNYAYIENGGSYNATIRATGMASLADIAALSNGAMFAGFGADPNPDYGNIATYAYSSNGTSAQRLIGSYDTTAVAVGDSSHAYVTGKMTEVENESALVVVDTGMASAIGTYIPLAGITPRDIATFQIGSDWYLGMIGNKAIGSAKTAWRIALNGEGLPDIGTIQELSLSGSREDATSYFCSTSPDGSLFWYTNPQTGSIKYINTSTWQKAGSINDVYGVTQLVGFSPIATPVPEPSSLVALAGFAAGAFGIFKRRK